nr:hypothetical protein [Yonghaparkia sp. Soil809]
MLHDEMLERDSDDFGIEDVDDGQIRLGYGSVEEDDGYARCPQALELDGRGSQRWQQQNARDLLLDQLAEHMPLHREVIEGVRQEDDHASVFEPHLHSDRRFSDDGVRDVGDDQPDDVPLLGSETNGIAVRDVPESCGLGLDAEPRLLGDLARVAEREGDRGARQAQRVRDRLHRHGAFLIHSTILPVQRN